ncbi:hypothetical protein [Marinicella rhabdoformis]|uniref:hypothetical protein n=1 Tax=Marinicella rhabdoformis TaxID=2580566 RepID=UPI0012AEBC31|nr:hypothetical protein [Marinicella rhabdoformis]
MKSLSISLLFLMTASTSVGAVTAFSVADDNFDMPDHLVEINLETGEYVSKGKLPDPYIAVEGLAMSASGKLYGADDNTKTLVQIETTHADAFAVGNANQNLGFGAVPESYDFGMTFACDSNMYMVVKHTNNLLQVNPTSGKATLIGNTGHNFTSVAAWGEELYAVASNDFNLYRIDKESANATVVGNMGDLGGNISLAGSGLAFDDQGQLWMVINLRLSDPLNPFPSRIFKINTQSGAADWVAETLVGIESLAIAPPGGCQIAGPAPQPIPGNQWWAMLALLLATLSVASRQIKKD